ncbi:MAG: hydrogenase iron-sulfur subunit [Burkholderiaceae bacterium]
MTASLRLPGIIPHPLRRGRLAALSAFMALERTLDRIGGSAHNPLRHLGSLGFLLFWLLAISGIYLFAVFDTSADGAYRSIDQLSRQQWYLGGVLRSVHRYAADAFIVVLLAHLLREALMGRYSGFRRFSWLTGVPLLLLAFTSAIGGFWLNWDQLGQFSAMATAEMLDVLPVFASPLTRNFLGTAAVSDRLFSLFIFVHVGVALFLVFGLWFHIQRLAHAAVFPPRPMAAAVVLGLLVLALVAPVMSHASANLAVAPTTLALDWILLFIHPLAYATSPALVGILLTLALLWLFALPFLPQRAQAPVAVVDPANCNGCRRCFDDCPYAAVTMVAHPLRSLRQMAQVDSDLCASCGICVGACPSSTPFRSAAELVTGIDMPAAPIGALRNRLSRGLAAMGDAPGKIVVFGCQHGADITRLARPDVLTLDLVCTGQLPPSFVEYALRDGADGVLVSGCTDGGCLYRLGQRWTAQRLHGTREPHLRDAAPRERLAVAWADAGDAASVARALQRLRQDLAPLPTAPAPTGAHIHV